MAASLNLEAATAESSHRSNFGESLKGEVRRINLSRTPVNTGKRKDRGPRLGPGPSRC